MPQIEEHPGVKALHEGVVAAMELSIGVPLYGAQHLDDKKDDVLGSPEAMQVLVMIAEYPPFHDPQDHAPFIADFPLRVRDDGYGRSFCIRPDLEPWHTLVLLSSAGLVTMTPDGDFLVTNAGYKFLRMTGLYIQVPGEDGHLMSGWSSTGQALRDRDPYVYQTDTPDLRYYRLWS